MADDRVVDFVEEGRIGGEVGSRHFDKFTAGVGEVSREKGLKGRGVCERFRKVIEGGLDFGEGSLCWPGRLMCKFYSFVYSI